MITNQYLDMKKHVIAKLKSDYMDIYLYLTSLSDWKHRAEGDGYVFLIFQIPVCFSVFPFLQISYFM